MKKLILVSAILLGLNASAQGYFSVSLKTDVKNALVGSKPTDYQPALDLLVNLNMIDDNNIELSVGYESFHKIGFRRYSVDLGYLADRYIPLGNKEFDFSVTPSIGFSFIQRYNMVDSAQSDISSHTAFQGNLSFRTKITDRLLLDFTTQLMTRPDLKHHYPNDNPKDFVLSNFVGIHYIIK